MASPSSNSKHFTAFRSALEEHSSSKDETVVNDKSVMAVPVAAPQSATVVAATNSRTAPKFRSPAEPGYGSADMLELGGDSERQTSRYRICFYNEIHHSRGTATHVCQRELEVDTSEGEDAAILLAIMEFEKLEQTSSWTTHARSIESTLVTKPS